MQKIAGVNVGIKYAVERPADVKHCKANAAKAFDILGFKANIQLEDGLAQYMDWHKKDCLHVGDK